MVGVNVKVYPGAAKTLLASQIKAVSMVAEQMLHEIVTEGVIPFDTGNLQNVATYVDTTKLKTGIVKIVHETPYAAKIYFHPEYNFQTTFNANAKGLWWEGWITGSKKDRPSKLYKHFYKQCCGGVVR